MERMAELFLWPGTKMCEHLDIDPKGDLGLLRSFFNMLFWLPLGLLMVWIFN
ncbi:hypothetical protein [Neptunicoccus sediminis]|uniref:hypothetical protein n=1 Tax=Neptunicoccus sediminis TaxID=1892596 RepID=UPI0012FF7E74|nr:hypothetical protein [Neptunicoccus sediminis]